MMTSTFFSRKLFVGLIFTLALSICTAVAFKEGDYIDGARRSRLGYDEMPTDWTTMIASQLPRFRKSREIVWKSLAPDELRTLGERDYKLQLAFDKGLYQTPWITMYSHNPMLVLKRLDIVFTYSESIIIDFKIYPDYTTLSELQASGGQTIVSYQWVEFGEHDADTAFAYLFGGTLLLALFFTFQISIRSTPNKKGRDLRA